MNFRVDLSIFRGPLDLLLFLVKRDELDLHDIPVARITDQFLEYLEVLEQIDVNAVGEFLEMASTLIEIKSRLVLPSGGEEVEVIEDPREELVARLLDYKAYRDAASVLEERSRRWQQHYSRLALDLPPRRIDPADQPIQEVELWDLVSAFGRIVRDNEQVRQTTIVYDDTPIHVYMQRIHEKLCTVGRCTFSEMFAPGMHKSALIGVFLAVLELVRHHSVRAEQVSNYAEIVVLPAENFRADVVFGEVDEYGGTAVAEEVPPATAADELPATPASAPASPAEAAPPPRSRRRRKSDS